MLTGAILPEFLWLQSGSGAGVAPPPDPTQLGVPSLIASPPVDTVESRTVAIAVAGPTSWPGGVLVQLQRRRLPGAFVDDALTATGTTLVLARESTDYVVSVRGFATGGGSLTDSDVSGVLSITVPALDGVGIALTARVRAIPSGSEAGAAPAGPRPAIVLRGDGSPNVLLIDRITNAEDTSPVTPTAVVWRLEERVGGAVRASGVAVATGATWRGVIQSTGGTGLVLVVDLVPTTGARTRLRYATSWVAQ